MNVHAIERPSAILLSILAVGLVGVTDGYFTQLSPWSAALARPAWHPPAWLFGPAWTLILGFAALSIADFWRSVRDPDAQRLIFALLAVNAGLNVAWSPLFFVLRRPDLALICMVLMLFAIASLIYVLRNRARRAALLLVPYFLWIAFASVLNFEIVRLNAPFGSEASALTGAQKR